MAIPTQVSTAIPLHQLHGQSTQKQILLGCETRTSAEILMSEQQAQMVMS